MIFIGMVFSFFYQYLLWAIGWHFNTLFLIYTLTYGLSLTILFLVVSSISRERIKYSIKKNFPVKGTAVFLFFISAMLFLKCLGEIAPTIPDGELKEPFIGYYNLFDQSLDIGIMIPFGVYIGILLLKRNEYGYLLSLVSLLLFLNLAISIITGEVVLGYMTGTLISRMMGVLFFSLFLIIDILILVKVLSAIDDMKDAGSKRAFFSGF
ncbi:MAG: hypothetical protein JEY91_05550 [Spirochaetaceae bacterium]|nr:hypothetical protein [Spirochaetaceae bacterium]